MRDRNFLLLFLLLTAVLLPYRVVLADVTSVSSAYEAVVPTSVSPPSPAASAPVAVPAVWRTLMARLAADGVSGPELDSWFARLGEIPTQDPMGRKIQELYRRDFLRTPPDPKTPKIPPPRFYKGVVTGENARLCREYITVNEKAFAAAEARYGVSRSIAAALIFVETRLGTVLGKESAFYTLASMAVSTAPEHISLWLPKLPGYEARLDWLAEHMPKRAEWAYKELRALLVYARTQNIDPFTMPGSIYGAVGICQFMPSNIIPYGTDGDGDGIVDLFTVADAVASLSHYLMKHGWKSGISRPRQHALLKRYNNANIYANTILALSDLIATTRNTAPDTTTESGREPARRKKH